MTEEEIVRRITGLYKDAKVSVSGADCNFEVNVVSTGFEGKTLLERQKSILALFSEDITSGALHALSIKTAIPK